MQTSIILALLGANSALAHMFLSDPPPLRSQDNPNAGGNVDSELKSPIQLAQFPCRGDLDLLGSEEGASVADYKAGESYSATIEGGAAHEGGSCQFSLSYDKGETWKVIQSIVGDCPVSGGSSFDFTIPADAPSSDEAVFSWSWINKIGNREFYQNCAVVSIQGSDGGKTRRADEVAFDDRPDMFVANIVDGCTTAEGTDVLFPDPGPDVLMNTEGTPPEGDNCGAPVEGGGGSEGGGSGGDTGSGGGSGGDTGSGGGSGGDTGSGGGNDGQYTPPAESGGAETSAPAESAPAESAPAGGNDGQYTAPAESAPAESAPAESAPAESAPAGGNDGQYTPPAESAPADGGEPARSKPAESAPAGGEAPAPTEAPSAPEASAPGGVFVTAPSAAPSGDASASGSDEAPAESAAPSDDSAAPAESAAPSGDSSAPSGDSGSDTPTTLETSAVASGTDSSSSPSETEASSPPSGTDSAGGGSSGGEGEQTGECEEEGSWNCIDGSTFQRCAAGQWSPATPMADGTNCQPGVGAELTAAPKLFRFRREY